MIHVKDVQIVQQHQKSFNKVHDKLLDDRRMKVREIAGTTGILFICVPVGTYGRVGVRVRGCSVPYK